MPLALTISRILYLVSLASAIGVGAFYANYLNGNKDTDRNNEISTISLIFFCVILFVVGTADILRYISGSSVLVRLIPVLGLCGSYAATIVYYYQDKNSIEDEYKVYFYSILALVGLAILSLVVLFLSGDKPFTPPTIGKYEGVSAKKIALEQTSDRIRKTIVKLKDKDAFKITVAQYQQLVKEIENEKDNRDKVDDLIIKSSYLYGGEQFVTNIMLSKYVDQKEKYSYPQAFEKIKELKNDRSNKIKLKDPKGAGAQATRDYNYDEIVNLYANKFNLDRDLLFSSNERDKCNDLLGHLPVIHGKDQKIIENSCK